MSGPLDRDDVHTLVDEAGRVVCARTELARTIGRRAQGLLGRSGIDQGEGLLLLRTSSIHTLFMQFPIDAVFIDRKLKVKAVVANLRPYRFVFRPTSDAVLELAAGEAARVGIEKGTTLAWQSRTDLDATDGVGDPGTDDPPLAESGSLPDQDSPSSSSV